MCVFVWVCVCVYIQEGVWQIQYMCHVCISIVSVWIFVDMSELTCKFTHISYMLIYCMYVGIWFVHMYTHTHTHTHVHTHGASLPQARWPQPVGTPARPWTAPAVGTGRNQGTRWPLSATRATSCRGRARSPASRWTTDTTGSPARPPASVTLHCFWCHWCHAKSVCLVNVV